MGWKDTRCARLGVTPGGKISPLTERLLPLRHPEMTYE